MGVIFVLFCFLFGGTQLGGQDSLLVRPGYFSWMYLLGKKKKLLCWIQVWFVFILKWDRYPKKQGIELWYGRWRAVVKIHCISTRLVQVERKKDHVVFNFQVSGEVRWTKKSWFGKKPIFAIQSLHCALFWFPTKTACYFKAVMVELGKSGERLPFAVKQTSLQANIWTQCKAHSNAHSSFIATSDFANWMPNSLYAWEVWRICVRVWVWP